MEPDNESWGAVQVSHCWHLHRLGWVFQALPAAFLVDLPHSQTKYRRVHRAEPALRASVDGLFQRFATEVDRAIATSNSPLLSSSAANPVKDPWWTEIAKRQNDRLVNDDSARDYEVLADMSLLAWGDAWIATGAYPRPVPKLCGGGWNLKGGHSAWAGLRVPWRDSTTGDGFAGVRRNIAELGSESTPSESDTVAFPPRMVGGWVRVCLGEDKHGRDGVNDGVGLHGRSAVRPKTLHGVMRYWVHPKWDPKQCLRGKLPGLGMSGDVRLFVRWHSGSVGFCSLMMLGRRLKDVCEVGQLIFRRKGRTSLILVAEGSTDSTVRFEGRRR